MIGSYGRSDPSGMTRLLVKGTYPPAPSGTVAGGANQQKKKKHAGIICSSSRHGRASQHYCTVVSRPRRDPVSFSVRRPNVDHGQDHDFHTKDNTRRAIELLPQNAIVKPFAFSRVSLPETRDSVKYQSTSFSITQTYVIEKEARRFKELEYVLIGKVDQLFRDMIEGRIDVLFPPSQQRPRQLLFTLCYGHVLMRTDIVKPYGLSVWLAKSVSAEL